MSVDGQTSEQPEASRAGTTCPKIRPLRCPWGWRILEGIFPGSAGISPVQVFLCCSMPGHPSVWCVSCFLARVVGPENSGRGNQGFLLPWPGVSGSGSRACANASPNAFLPHPKCTSCMLWLGHWNFFYFLLLFFVLGTHQAMLRNH